MSSGPDAASEPRRRGRPAPRFKSDISDQVDFMHGTPALAVSAEHPARRVLELVEALDVSLLEGQRSWLGRHGFEPRRVLAVWIYASLQGVHAASKVELAAKTDLAYRFLSGGHPISARSLQRFRADNLAFFEDALRQTVSMAVQRGLVDPKQLAVDSMRLQADASSGSVRTRTRSAKRLKELAAADTSAHDASAAARHAASVEKHTSALARCDAEDRTSHCVTDPHAALMKFPSGAAHPGHRVTVGAAGATTRLVVAAFVDSDPTDYGKLTKAVTAVEKSLIQAGITVVPGEATFQVAADAGYLAEDDLAFAARVRSRIDILIPIPEQPGQRLTRDGEERQFGKEQFVIGETGVAVCPAGTVMDGPFDAPNGMRTWRGVGCPECPLRPQCTTGQRRTLSENLRSAKLREAMKLRMSLEGAKSRYNKRIATVEPIFSYIEDTMGFRRSTSRRTDTVRAEVFMKLLAYNLLRLYAAVQPNSLDCVVIRNAG